VVTRFAALDEAQARSKPNPALEKMGVRMAHQWEQAIEKLPKKAPSEDLVPVIEGLRTLFQGMAELSKSKLDLQGKKPHEQLEAAERFQAEEKQKLKALNGQYGALMKKFAPQPDAQGTINGLASMNVPTNRPELRDVTDKLVHTSATGEPLTLTTKELNALTAQLDPQSMRDNWDRVDGLITQRHALGESREESDQAKRGMERLRQHVASMGDSEADGAQRLVETMKAYAAIPGGVTMPSPPLEGEDWEGHSQRFIKEAKRPQFEPLKNEDLMSPDVACRPGLHLRKRTVGGWCLRGLDLRGAKLESMTLIGCDLRNCTLSESVWDDCTLIGCDLSGATVDRAQVRNTRLQWCCLNNVSGLHSHWESAQFTYGLAQSADWQHSHWTAGTVVEADFRHSDWRSSTLMRQTMLKVPFGEALFSEALATRSAWVECQLEQSTWDGCVLKGCYLGEANLPTSWRRASLTHVSLRCAALNSANWRDAQMDGVDCSEASMQNCDFSGLQASNVHALGADLRNSNFEAAHITGGLFIGADLRGTRFVNAMLEHCSFGLAQQDDCTDFTGAYLSSSNFHPKQAENLK
jgi:uncharacterized protein YjbI with pentapeptide repeats